MTSPRPEQQQTAIAALKRALAECDDRLAAGCNSTLCLFVRGTNSDEFCACVEDSTTLARLAGLYTCAKLVRDAFEGEK